MAELLVQARRVKSRRQQAPKNSLTSRLRQLTIGIVSSGQSEIIPEIIPMEKPALTLPQAAAIAEPTMPVNSKPGWLQRLFYRLPFMRRQEIAI
ncbi:MAG: hypothetical protein A2729_01105 [Candidatus Buchananbacteria bacterium RIFCSPHIGHO2_01_FULL_39_14]|uniref:Uncharacterized protein n=2 Tax=Candidatus Buchananiibacteriota TaxID=1817903 RepID=A0A1G1YU79_9BACT|nr:MAG: hypothetical protein A2729_01105 [Candidatus Buchananbacteria bacterium RIFCSPHIGHO2_01_FULL_39_14]OGY49180.1 MAG: hypothetical protein A3D39_05735 [Candidatus Buchananbacteria bacterium RIFCSPHIGHO2_02_FULL_39_17]OGY55913.1 MAG: hypothetical protein A2912_02915 [Candidatus Buchananbacteria bacterium RIFCSPLOWO2_01_FULL_40_23b]